MAKPKGFRKAKSRSTTKDQVPSIGIGMLLVWMAVATLMLWGLATVPDPNGFLNVTTLPGVSVRQMTEFLLAIFGIGFPVILLVGPTWEVLGW